MSFLPHDLHLEILKRIPPLPHVLACTSAVCKAWHRVVNDRGFLRELYRSRRGAPATTLGFFHNSEDDDLPQMFVPAGDPVSFALDDRRTEWNFVDSRHGRVLLSDGWDHRFLVWHPMTGERHLVRAKALDMPEAPNGDNQVGAALLCGCAVADDEEGQGQRPGCHASPFRVAVVFKHPHEHAMLASVFSSLTGQWRTLELPLIWNLRSEPCTVVGNVLYQPLVNRRILAFDTDLQILTTLERPRCCNVRLLKVHGGLLGMAGLMGSTLQLWMARDADAEDWVLLKTVDLKTIPGLSAAPSPKTDPRFTTMPPVKIIGVTEEGDALFLWTMIGIFMLRTESMELTKVHGTPADNLKTVYPYASFYLPASAI